MIPVPQFVSTLTSAGIDFFCGVPDSLLKNFCAYITDNCGDTHVITANEGGAVGLAAGHYLATGRCQEASAEFCMPIKEIISLI